MSSNASSPISGSRSSTPVASIRKRGCKSRIAAVTHHQGALQRVQLLASGEPLNRAHRASLRLHREHQANGDGVAIDQHSASPADAMLTTHMRAGQAALVADGIEQGPARLQP
jgi:hypothetical protein